MGPSMLCARGPSPVQDHVTSDYHQMDRRKGIPNSKEKHSCLPSNLSPCIEQKLLQHSYYKIEGRVGGTTASHTSP